MTDYLLCVLIILLAYLLGEVAGKQPAVENRPVSGLITVIGLIASLVLGAGLYLLLVVVVPVFGGALILGA